MTAQSSNAVDIKAAIVNLIRNLPEAQTEEWDVGWGFVKTPARTFIYVGEIQFESSDWVTNRSREEVISLMVGFNVKRRRGSPEEAEREVMRITGLVDKAITQKPDISGGAFQVVTSGFVPKRMDSWPVDEYTEAQCEAEVRVTARFSIV